MTTTTIDYRFVVRRGTAAAWTSSNQILLAGEIGLETDTGLAKMGDGSTVWTALAYWSGSASKLLDAVFGNTQGSILYRGAAAWKVLAPGSAGQVLQSGGAAANPIWGSASGSGGGGGINFGIGGAPAASQMLLLYPVGSGGLTLNAGLPGFGAYCESAPTSAVTITLYKNGTSIGTINWAAGAKAGTCSFASAVSFASGDTLTAVFQSSADATFANFGVCLVPVGSGSGLTLVNTASGSTTTANIPITGFISGKKHRLVIDINQSASNDVRIGFSNDGGSTVITGGNYVCALTSLGSTNTLSTTETTRGAQITQGGYGTWNYIFEILSTSGDPNSWQAIYMQGGPITYGGRFFMKS